MIVSPAARALGKIGAGAWPSSAQVSGRLTVAKVNVDHDAENAGRLGVQGVPTMILFHDGKELMRIVGALDKASIERRIDEALTTAKIG